MISNEDKQKIIDAAKKYGVSRILLFGSSAIAGKESRDIDLGVSGLPPKQFFMFYSELYFSLSKPVDLVELESKSRFANMVAEEGMPLYG
jgi:predicted nucleotidyltransferase